MVEISSDFIIAKGDCYHKKLAEKKQKGATAILTWSLLGLVIAASSFTAVSAVISFMSGIVEEGGSQAPVSFISRIK